MNIANFLQNIGNICGLTSPAEVNYDSTQLLKEHTEQNTKGAKSLAGYLSYRYFDPKCNIFFNENNVIGFMLEIAPIVGTDVNLEKNLSLFFNNELPVNCYLQFLLIASHNIEQKLKLWSNARSNPNQMLQQLTEFRREFISKCAKDFTSSDGRMAKDFRIYVSFSKKSEGNNSVKSIEEVVVFQSKLVKKLQAIKLSPRICDAQNLMFVAGDMAQMQMQERLSRKYDPINPLANQILTPLSRTIVKEDCLIHLDSIYNDNGLKPNKLTSNNLASNKLVSKCFYPSMLPEQWSLLEMINLLGSASDHSLPARLIISYTVANNVSKTQSSKILARGHRSIHAAEQWYARHDTNLKKEALEWREIIAKAKNGEQFLTESLQIMITAPQSEIEIAEEFLISLYNAHDFQLQVNKHLQLPAMLSQLPMHQALSWKFLQHFQLVKIAQAKEVIAKLPIHGEWKGVNQSGVLLIGRRGELFNWNPFVRINSGNYNVAVMAPSGSGKSVFLQELATSMLAQNASVFILDIGGSYQNICELIGGETIRFNQHSNISLNPFAQIAGSGTKHAKALSMLARNYNLVEIGSVTGLSLEQIEMLTAKDQDQNLDLDQRIEILQIGNHFVTKDSIIYAKSIIGAMCGVSKDAHKEAIIERAINEGIEKHGTTLDITKLTKVLEELEGATTAKALAETLYPYSEKGVHGKFFEQGKAASFKEILTIFEFEEVKNDPILLAVILQVVLMQVTMQFLCGDRSKQFLLIVDEAWMILDYSAKFLESFGRTVRKYGGSLVICVQNFTDFQKSDERRSILENSAWTVILKQDEKGLNSFSTSEAFKDIVPLIESISLIPSKYAEMLLISTGLKVVGRLSLDPYSQVLYSTEAADFKYLLEARRSGLSKDEAVKALAKKYGELAILPTTEKMDK
ncbi:TraC family protein [Candidatus Tisiphia endosymbiont of Melanophora roralis]|uniref:TraC family protein n=1 Tax=Candidatus Tisiphia endosymbiont of Melanophora roralis TaxID=3066261 RepID=UPI001E752BCB|nr:MAG: TraC family protein [Rickettsia endosymbiont of Cimex lectularius]